MKRFFVFLSLMTFALVLVACKHSHQASSDWAHDATNHWHTCTGCDELLDISEHTYGEWSVVTEATETAKGSEKRACNVCGYEETREIPQLSHTHSYASQISSNSTHHWYECSCGDKKDYAEHTYGEWLVVTEATETAKGSEKRACNVCGYEETREIPQLSHTCTFIEGVCECGKTEVGAFDKTIDGSLEDWSTEEKANALKTFGESGTGFSVVGYHKDSKAYFATTIVTAEAAPNSFEIFQKDGATRYIIARNSETDEWSATDGADYLIALYVTKSEKDGLNVYEIESLWDFTAFPKEENGNYKIHFSVACPEKSAASYSDTQSDYWVLYAKNAWNPDWNFELNVNTEFGHEHILDSNFDCIICGENFKLTDLAITLDGKSDDWASDVLETMLVSYDEEDRWIKQVGFTDDKYLYLFVSIAHRDPVGNMNIIIGANHFGQVVSGSVFTFNNVEDGCVIEYKDETGSFTVTDYEIVLSLDKIKAFSASSVTDAGVKLGFDISNTTNENSHGFACAPDKLFMWAIAGYNSWAPSLNFVYGTSGVSHTHDWNEETGICKLCPEEMPTVQYDIVADGDLSDWKSSIVEGSSKTYGESGTGWEIMGYRVGTTVYLGVTIKTNGAIPALFGLVDRASEGYGEHYIKYENGEWVKLPEVTFLGSSLNDTDSIDTYVLEMICDFSGYNPIESGDYLFGINVNVNEKSAASWSNDNIAYWVMFGRNAWAADNDLFAITENGITHNHKLGYAIKVDGLADDWSTEIKATSLKGRHKDSDDKTRGVEYISFTDDDYIYIYTKTITATNAAKGLDIIFNKNGELLSTSLWADAPGANIVAYNFTTNVLLENGLYETVSEIVLDKNAYVNSNGNVFVGIWFAGCDDGFAPLSWHESGKTTIWGLNNRCPWWKGTNQQKVTATGFDHYHDLNSDNVCGWCQETVELPITVDGDSSDWDADVLATTKTGGNIKAAAFTDADHVYFYIEVTQTGANEPNYLCIEGTNADGIRTKTGFNLFFDAGTSALRPWCNSGWWGCVNYCDCDNGFVKYAMNRTTNEEGQLVIQYELVVDKDLIAKANGEVWVEVAIDDTVAWASAGSLTGWEYMQITENGIQG